MPDDASLCESCGAARSHGTLDRICESCRDAASVPMFRSDATVGGIPPAPNDVPPISKHQLFEEIAHGGMSTVHRARQDSLKRDVAAVSYTHLRAHETPEHLVCRLLLEKKKK